MQAGMGCEKREAYNLPGRRSCHSEKLSQHKRPRGACLGPDRQYDYCMIDFSILYISYARRCRPP